MSSSASRFFQESSRNLKGQVADAANGFATIFTKIVQDNALSPSTKKLMVMPIVLEIIEQLQRYSLCKYRRHARKPNRTASGFSLRFINSLLARRADKHKRRAESI